MAIGLVCSLDIFRLFLHALNLRCYIDSDMTVHKFYVKDSVPDRLLRYATSGTDIRDMVEYALAVFTLRIIR